MSLKICIECGRKLRFDEGIPVRAGMGRAFLCPKCYYAGVPSIAPRFNPNTHILSYCTHFKKPFAAPKQAVQHGVVKCPYCGGRHQVKSVVSPNPSPSTNVTRNPVQCRFCGTKFYGPYYGPLMVCPKCKRDQKTGEKKGANPKKGLRQIESVPPEVIRREINAEVKEWMDKIGKAHSMLERKQILKDLVKKALRSEVSTDIVRIVVYRGNMLLELKQVQQEIDTERLRERRGR